MLGVGLRCQPAVSSGLFGGLVTFLSPAGGYVIHDHSGALVTFLRRPAATFSSGQLLCRSPCFADGRPLPSATFPR
jgi:hypothetical protein